MSKAKQKDLNQNELAAWLSNVNTSIEPYSKPIAVLVGLLIVGGVAWGLYTGKVVGDRSDATLQLLMNDDEVATKYPDTAAAAWSKIYSANKNLDNGIQALYTNRSDAETLLTEAKQGFDEAIGESEDSLLRSRGYLGLALASESLGELDNAIEMYKKCIAENESEAMVQKAETRIKELSSPDIKKFVAWFGEQDFSIADPSSPPELPGGGSLPKLPDLELGPMLSGDKDGEKGDEMELKDSPGEIELPKDADPKNAEPKNDDSKEQGDAKAKESLDLPKGDDVKAKAKEAAEKVSETVKESTAKVKDAVVKGGKDATEVVTEKVKEAAESGADKK